jgi:hypothetical protein
MTIFLLSVVFLPWMIPAVWDDSQEFLYFLVNKYKESLLIAPLVVSLSLSAITE